MCLGGSLGPAALGAMRYTYHTLYMHFLICNFQNHGVVVVVIAACLIISFACATQKVSASYFFLAHARRFKFHDLMSLGRGCMSTIELLFFFKHRCWKQRVNSNSFYF